MRLRVADALGMCPLYFILDNTLCINRDPVDVGRQALESGVRMLQLRLKDRTAAELTQTAIALKQLMVSPGWLLIVNDSVEAALAAGADGVHLGQDDMPIVEARKAGPNLIIGATARTPEAAKAAAAAGADYLGSGSVYPSPTKPGLPVIGTGGLAEICAGVEIPVAAIGGINQDNVRDVMAAGAAGFCSVAPFAAGRRIGAVTAELIATASGSAGEGSGA